MNSEPLAWGPPGALRFEIVKRQHVTAGSCSTLALIVDNDLGFLMWLGEVFAEAGCQAVPALHCRQALTLAKRVNSPITTLVLNPELPGAARTVKLLLAANPAMQIVFIRPSTADPEPGDVNYRRLAKIQSSGIPVRFWLERPSALEPISRLQWVAKIRKILARCC
jgi:hypothetical protein